MDLEQHGKTLMLLKKSSKQARSGFKRKRLSVAGTYQEIKAKGAPPPSTAPFQVGWSRSISPRG